MMSNLCQSVALPLQNGWQTDEDPNRIESSTEGEQILSRNTRFLGTEQYNLVIKPVQQT